MKDECIKKLQEIVAEFQKVSTSLCSLRLPGVVVEHPAGGIVPTWDEVAALYALEVGSDK